MERGSFTPLEFTENPSHSGLRAEHPFPHGSAPSFSLQPTDCGIRKGWVVKCPAWISSHVQEEGVDGRQPRLRAQAQLMHSCPRWAREGHAREETGRRNDSICGEGEQEVSSRYKNHKQSQIQEAQGAAHREGSRAVQEDFLKEGVCDCPQKRVEPRYGVGRAQAKHLSSAERTRKRFRSQSLENQAGELG